MTPESRLPAEDGGESGFTLIEVILAVAIIGIAFVALLGAMATAVSASGLHRTQAVAELEVRRYAELVEAAPWNLSGYTAGGVGYTPGAAASAPYNIVTDAPTLVSCTPVACGGAGVQTETVQVGVHSADMKVQESVQLTKRAP